MLKIFTIFYIFLLSLGAQTIKFEEEKYIEALDNTIKKIGILEFDNSQIKLKYDNSSKVLIYNNDKLIVKTEEESQELDLKNQLALKMIFLLIETIFKDDYKSLEEFFFIKQDGKIYYLKPKENLENYIKEVEFKKDKRLNYFIISMSNGNKTTIRELDD